MQKPKWVIAKEQHKRKVTANVWLFGIHAVRDALRNPKREKLRLVVTKNAYDKIADDIAASGMDFETTEPRAFDVPIDPQSVHQGVALEVKPLEWGSVEDVCLGEGEGVPTVVLLDQVTDPHNVGAILRSAEVFGAEAVIATARHAAPETGALAKTASGALERQPYLRVRNLSDTIVALREMGFIVLGLDGTAEVDIEDALSTMSGMPVALVMGAEGAGLRNKTKENCDALVKIPFSRDFGSLNVSNAAAVALYSVSKR